MASLYPQALDEFRDYVQGLDHLQASDVQALFAAAVALQVELGVLPGAETGSVHSRLFGLGNISERGGGWNRLRYDAQLSALWQHYNNAGGPGAEYSWPDSVMRGQDTIFGEDIPALFMAVQSPLVSQYGAQGRGSVPWRAWLGPLGSSFGRIYAIDGEGYHVGQTPDLQSTMGVLAWNLIT